MNDFEEQKMFELEDRVAELEAKVKDLRGAAEGLYLYRDGTDLHDECVRFVKEFSI